eukprot:73178-Karenia_brevis.AAC.1
MKLQHCFITPLSLPPPFILIFSSVFKPGKASKEQRNIGMALMKQVHRQLLLGNAISKTLYEPHLLGQAMHHFGIFASIPPSAMS